MLIKKRNLFKACAKTLDTLIILLVKIKNTNYIATSTHVIVAYVFKTLLCNYE